LLSRLNLRKSRVREIRNKGNGRLMIIDDLDFVSVALAPRATRNAKQREPRVRAAPAVSFPARRRRAAKAARRPALVRSYVRFSRPTGSPWCSGRRSSSRRSTR
jgi:hypothetical protein